MSSPAPLIPGELLIEHDWLVTVTIGTYFVYLPTHIGNRLNLAADIGEIIRDNPGEEIHIGMRALDTDPLFNE